MKKKHGIVRNIELVAVALAVVVAALLLVYGASAQSNKPISRKGLVESVKANGLSTTELVRIINRRGVAFEMTPDAEAELRGVGARPEVIEAARSNYRAAATPSVASRPATSTRPVNTTPSASVPAGPPLSKNEIITMLQGGITPARVEQFVEARGVSFSMNAEIAREITAAGGNRSLVGAITEKATGETASSSGNTSSPFADNGGGDDNSGAPGYDDYIDRAQAAIGAQDWSSAINYAQQAVQLDPQQPTAYTILGTMMLYASRNLSGAEQAMGAAIQRGGAAAFKVYHDHDGNFNTYCEGSFFVTKTGVSFKANDGRDTFEAEDSNIKEAKTNAWVGSQYGAFHIKPLQKINGRDNFNFAPGSQQKSEAELILRMIKNF